VVRPEKIRLLADGEQPEPGMRADAHKFQGRPTRLAWTADHTYILDTKER